MGQEKLKKISFEKDFSYWLGFNFFEGIGPLRFKLLLDYFGSAKKIWQAPAKELREVGLGPELVRKFSSFRRWFEPKKIKWQKGKFGAIISSQAVDWAKEQLWWPSQVSSFQKEDQEPILVLTWMDKLYPKRLRQIDASPPVIYLKGEMNEERTRKLFKRRTLAVIGTRKVSQYGRWVTEKLVFQLVEAGVVIVSGMARGVDGIAHRTAIRNKGQTIAVLGSGVDVVYPLENKDIYQRLINSSFGIVVSELPPGFPPLSGNFPARNRLIAALSEAVLVTEAAHKSGTLITSRLAAEQGKDVFAVPGPITSHLSDGTSWLIKQGAKLISSVDDILEEIKLDFK